MGSSEAAMALRAAHRRASKQEAPSFNLQKPSTRKLQDALRVLGVPPEESIGREVGDRDALVVDLDCLKFGMAKVCGEADASGNLSRLRDLWEEHVKEGDEPSVQEVA